MEKSKLDSHIKNARNFIQHTKEKYDLIVYGLLDSHTSLSARGGIRLDSYVYTVDAFKEETYEKLRVGGKLKKLLENIHTFLKVKKDQLLLKQAVLK